MSKQKWTVDPIHTSADFEVEHMSISTYRNRFRTLSGSLELDEADPSQSSLAVDIDVRSIAVEDKRLYDRLMDEDFFFAQQHPTIQFRSTRVEKLSDREWKVDGTLSIRGVQRAVTLDVQDFGGANHPFARKPMRAFRATGSLDRGEFGMKWNAPMDTGAKYLGEKVTLLLHAEFLKQQ